MSLLNNNAGANGHPLACVGHILPLHPGDFVDAQTDGVHLLTTTVRYEVGRGVLQELGDAQIQIRSNKLYTSCHHVALICSAVTGRTVLLNHSPRNGTYMNSSDIPLSTNTSIRLEDGDIIHLGPPCDSYTGSFVYRRIFSDV
ncbi:unnamed protein product [Peniophora sp. CBMAI 1063]|nr:unnamed protein product [Peniophora sp. CBMAI 1063]